MGAALELIPLMPYDKLGTHVPGRPRSYRTLAFHLFRVIDAFVGTNEGTTLVQAMFPRGAGQRRRHRRTGRLRHEDPPAVPPVVGHERPCRVQEAQGLLRPAKPARDCSSGRPGHSGQHVRQYMMLLEKEGVSHHRPLVDPDFAKLPMPRNVWDG